MDLYQLSVTNLFAAIQVVADGHTKIFEDVCDLKALTMKGIVSFSTVTLTCCDSQHSALLWVEAHLQLGFPVLQSR